MHEDDTDVAQMDRWVETRCFSIFILLTIKKGKMCVITLDSDHQPVDAKSSRSIGEAETIHDLDFPLLGRMWQQK